MRTNHPINHRSRFHLTWLPTSTAGRWASVLEIGFIACFALMQLFVALGERGSSLWLVTTALAGGGAAIAGAIMAAFAIVRRHERSISVIAAGLLGGLVLLFLAGELLIPH